MISRIMFSVDGSSGVGCNCYFNARMNADIVTAPFTPKKILFEAAEVNGTVTLETEKKLVMPEKTDLWITANRTGGGGTDEVSVAYSITLIPKHWYRPPTLS